MQATTSPPETGEDSSQHTSGGKRRRPRRRVRRWLLAMLGVGLVAVGPFLYFEAMTWRAVYSPKDVPKRRVAIVFGAGIYSNRRPMPFLAHRLDVAVDLYREGKVEKLLMTGDNSSEYHDEVTAMKSYAVEAGVDPADVTLDYAGFDTYDSCYRARAIFGVREAILVTQDYHLPRAVYTCRQLGVQAVGTGPSEWRRKPREMVGYQARELLADWKAFWDVHVSRRKPKFLGPREETP